jgi:alpha-L-rhamnosidase
MNNIWTTTFLTNLHHINMRLNFLPLLFLTLQLGAQPRAVNLKCEHLINPLGIDVPNPRLSWQLDDSRMGARQTAYQIVVGTDSVAISKGKGNIWDSHKILSDSTLIAYQGIIPQPHTKYFW